MSLIVDVRINDRVVARVIASRISGGEEPDSICRYRINHESSLVPPVIHRYGDGAIELAKKILPYALQLDNFKADMLVYIPTEQRSLDKNGKEG